MKVRKLITDFLILLLIIMQTGCGNTEGRKLSTTSINVNVERVKTININETIAYSGTIEASETWPLSFSSIGTINKVFVSEGDIVNKGALLAQLDQTTFENSYALAAASEKQAEDAYNRLKPMYENGNLPEIKFVEVETGLKQAKASAAIARKSLNDCKLYAPVDGIIGSRSIDPGMSVMPGLSAITIVKTNKVFAKVSISENEISGIKKGQKAIINISALNNKEFEGAVEEVGVVADPIAHAYKIKIRIPNENNIIKPGMICNVRIEKITPFEGVIIPNQALLTDELGKTFLFTIDEKSNTVKREYVKAGKLLKEGIEIVEGLSEGELIVVEGQQKLVDNSKVKIVKR